MTTFLADLRILSRTFHSLFFATKKRIDEQTSRCISFVTARDLLSGLLPITPTTQTTTMIATMAPREMAKPPVLCPEAPASLPVRGSGSPGYDDSVASGKAEVLVAMMVAAVFCACRNEPQIWNAPCVCMYELMIEPQSREPVDNGRIRGYISMERLELEGAGFGNAAGRRLLGI